MNLPTSEYLSHRAMRGLNKVGDIVAPGFENMPQFSDTGCILYIDEIMRVTKKADVDSLNILLTIIAIMPCFFAKALLWLGGQNEKTPDFIGSQLRLLDIGLRGVIISLYYSGLSTPEFKGTGVHQAMGYDVHCQSDYTFKNW